MTKLTCGCNEKDIEWVGLAQNRLDEALDEYIENESKIYFFKDLLKYKTILPMYLLICNRSVAECKKELERWESEQCTHQNFMIRLGVLNGNTTLATQ